MVGASSINNIPNVDHTYSAPTKVFSDSESPHREFCSIVPNTVCQRSLSWNRIIPRKIFRFVWKENRVAERTWSNSASAAE